MLPFGDLIQQGSAHAWLFIPSAILLGALHGLEPGHSKAMMAAFIVAIRGTMAQAVLLGLAATVSHTAIVWGIALGGMYLWRGVAPESLEPWLQLTSGLIVVGIAFWMLVRTRNERRAAVGAAGHAHADGSHHDDVRRLDTGHGILRIEIFETGVPPRWRIFNEGSACWAASDVNVATERPNGPCRSSLLRIAGPTLNPWKRLLSRISSWPASASAMAVTCMTMTWPLWRV